MDDAITIRHSTGVDRAGILRLGVLDDRPAPAGEMLLAFVDGELRAALPLAGGDALADPFHPTTDLLELLRFRATGEKRRGPRNGRWPLHRLPLFAS
jgi:hypothetical protein